MAHWANKITREVGRVLLINSVSPSGEKRFFYIVPMPKKVLEMKHLLATGAEFDLADYGEVVWSGYGEPDEETHNNVLKKL